MKAKLAYQVVMKAYLSRLEDAAHICTFVIYMYVFYNFNIETSG